MTLTSTPTDHVIREVQSIFYFIKVGKMRIVISLVIFAIFILGDEDSGKLKIP